jgi:carbonic anhydrase/acetyltransferase-like protein (isoleucine patch superfamily)
MNIRSFENNLPQIDRTAYIDAASTVIGNVKIGSNSSIWPNTVIRGDVNTITIGSNTNIQDGSILHCTHDGPYTSGGQGLVIGNNITVGHMVMLHAATIDDYCLIGMNAVLLDKCHIESYTLIAAGSLVPQGKRLESGFLWMGQPVKKIRHLNQDERDNIAYSAEHYVKLSKKY